MKKIIAVTALSLIILFCENPIAMAQNQQVVAGHPDNFSKYLMSNIMYVLEARQKHAIGDVTALFSVDTHHQIEYIKIVKSPLDAMSNEVIRVLKANPYLIVMKPKTNYTIAINFIMNYLDGNPLKPGLKTTNSELFYSANGAVFRKDAPVVVLPEVPIHAFIQPDKQTIAIKTR